MRHDADIEQVLVGIWSDVLGVSAVGIYDDFLELGGHSLLAGQIHSRVQRKFGVMLKARELDNTTIAWPAAQIRVASQTAPSTSGPPIASRGHADQAEPHGTAR